MELLLPPLLQWSHYHVLHPVLVQVFPIPKSIDSKLISFIELNFTSSNCFSNSFENPLARTSLSNECNRLIKFDMIS